VLNLKISIGTNTKEGPWGGGNLFAINLKKYLEENGHQVINNLDDNDIDLILITEPRKTSESSAFTHVDVENYLKFINKNALVVHRINECDERKNTNYVNKYLIEANKIADSTVFVSTWIKELYLEQGLNCQNVNVILAGADSKIFNNKYQSIWKKGEKIKIATHHWGANWNKGFEIYSRIDKLLEDKLWNDRIEFSYIGNLPPNFTFKNSKHVPPISGFELSSKLKEHHVYITGSLNEPSGNHHIEASQCGLPVMFLDSGGVKEYCEDYGLEYNYENFEEKLIYFIENYNNFLNKMSYYPFNSNLMCKQYLLLFEYLINNKKEFLNLRTIKNSNIFQKKLFFINKNLKKFIIPK
jgi:hypothetical protein